VEAKEEGQPAWAESQFYQLQHQIEAFKHLAQGESVPAKVQEGVALLKPYDWAYKRALIHQETMNQYEERFESNNLVKS